MAGSNLRTGVGSDNTPPKYQIGFACSNPNRLSALSRSILLQIMEEAGVEKVLITRIAANAREQAEAMYRSVEKKGLSSQMQMYKAGGKAVLEHLSREQDAIKRAEQKGIDTGLVHDKLARHRHLVGIMERHIDSVGVETVSKHGGNQAILNVFDVAPDSLYPNNKNLFIDAATHHLGIYKFLYPPKHPGERAYHFEIPQGQDGFIRDSIARTA